MKNLLCFTVFCSLTVGQTTNIGGSRIQAGTTNYCGISGGSANAYTVTLGTGSLITGMTLSFKPNFTNTGTATLNVDSLGATPVKLSDGVSNLSAGVITSGTIVTVVYDGTNFELLGASTQSSVAIRHVFSSAGTFSFVHSLGTIAPISSCYSASGTNTFRLVPTSSSAVSVTTNGPADITCSFYYAPSAVTQ